MSDQIKKLTAEEALNRVQGLSAIAKKDNEAAHGAEDALYFDFVEGIAAGLYEIEEAVEVAKIIMTTQDVDFHRYYA